MTDKVYAKEQAVKTHRGIMITETMARALTLSELMDRMIGHDDPAVRSLVERAGARLNELEQLLIDNGIEYDDQD